MRSVLAMGKYDDLIGGGKIVIDVNGVLEEQQNEIKERKALVERLIQLTVEDIAFGADDTEYLNHFLEVLKAYLKRL